MTDCRPMVAQRWDLDLLKAIDKGVKQARRKTNRTRWMHEAAVDKLELDGIIEPAKADSEAQRQTTDRIRTTTINTFRFVISLSLLFSCSILNTNYVSAYNSQPQKKMMAKSEYMAFLDHLK